jgi:CHASE3 domain sensor protein
MNNLFKTLIAGYGAKKLGGGCFSTILIFVIIYWALGTCNKNTNTNNNVQQRTGIVIQKNTPSKI